MIPELSVILVNYNEREFLRTVLDRLQTEFSAETTQCIVIDNNSRDGSAAMVRTEFSSVTLIEPHENLFYGKGNNRGLEIATGDWVMILNPDVEWQPGSLRHLVDWARTKPGVDVAAPQLRYRNGQIQISAHHRFPSLWTTFVDYCLPLQQALMRFGRHPYQLSAADHHRTQVIAHATGACLLVRREVIRTVGHFDPQFTMYLEETDWQARMAAAGFQSWLFADAQIIHYGSAQKSFAQASRHYLWGLRYYASKHWTINQLTALPPTVMAAAVLSLIFLLLLFFPSFALGRNGKRLRHYLKIYFNLVGKILTWPRRAPHHS